MVLGEAPVHEVLSQRVDDAGEPVLLRAHYTMPTTHHTLPTTHYTLHNTHYSHYSPLYYSLYSLLLPPRFCYCYSTVTVYVSVYL